MGWMKVSGIAKAAVAGAFIALPALAFPALAHAAPANDIVCIARTATTCYYLIPAAPQAATDATDVSNAPSTYSWDDEGYDTGGGGAAGGG